MFRQAHVGDLEDPYIDFGIIVLFGSNTEDVLRLYVAVTI
jgi:hypothetical protein